jgi:hypothetical protein
LATSVTGTGYPGENTPAALVAQTDNSVGIVTSSLTNYGIRAGSFGSTAVYGETYLGPGSGVQGNGLFPNTYGVVGNAAPGTGAGGYFTGGTTALRTLGGLQLTGIGEQNGYVLASDASGNATWQDLITPDVHLSAANMAPIIVAASTATNITSWGTLDEGGGANYNPVTGEYTISVAGNYSVFLHFVWSGNAPSAGANGIQGQINLNGVTIGRGYSASSITGNIPDDINAQLERHFNVGDKINFAVFQNTTGGMQIDGADSKFGIHLIHK